MDSRRDIRARVFVLDRRSNSPLPNVPVLLAGETRSGEAVPISILVTDHVGYVSFSVEGNVLPRDIAHVWVFPNGVEDARVDVLPSLLSGIASPFVVLSLDR